MKTPSNLFGDWRSGRSGTFGLLDSALGRPRSTAFGEDAYPTLEPKAASLLHSLAGNHPLVDGNQRLAWAATVVFVGLNNDEPSLSDDEAFELVLGYR